MVAIRGAKPVGWNVLGYIGLKCFGILIGVRGMCQSVHSSSSADIADIAEIEKAKPNAHHGGAETRRKKKSGDGRMGCGELSPLDLGMAGEGTPIW
jgi:hypothetical protein